MSGKYIRIDREDGSETEVDHNCVMEVLKRNYSEIEDGIDDLVRGRTVHTMFADYQLRF